MAWFKCHDWLLRHPSVKRLARTLKIPIPQAIGHLVMLTVNVFEYAEGGDLSEFEDVEIASAAEWSEKPARFRAALRSSGIITEEGKLFYWQDCVWNLLKARGLNNERQRRHRAEALHNASGHALHNASGHALHNASGHALHNASGHALRHESEPRDITRTDKTRQDKRRQDKTKRVCKGEGLEGGGASAASQPHTHDSKFSPDLPTWDQWQAAGVSAGMPEVWIQEEWQNQERKKMRERWKGLATDAAGLKAHASFVLGLKRQRSQSHPAAPAEIASKTL